MKENQSQIKQIKLERRKIIKENIHNSIESNAPVNYYPKEFVNEPTLIQDTKNNFFTENDRRKIEMSQTIQKDNSKNNILKKLELEELSKTIFFKIKKN